MNKLIQMAALAAVLSIIANFIIRIVFVATFDLSTEFPPFAFPAIAFFTVMGVMGAAIVFAIVKSSTANPVRTFTIIAAGVLVLSLIPDIALIVGDPDPERFPDLTTEAVIALILMHFVTAGFVLWLFPRAVDA